jgi:hypothetical protein
MLRAWENRRDWPEAAQNNIRSHVGNWEISGRLMLTLGFVESDLPG